MNPATLSTACTLVRAETSRAFSVLNARRFLIASDTGFYPRVRAVREEVWALSIDFWMTLDKDGRYRTEWSRDAPFELGGAAAVTRRERGALIRYWKSHVLYVSRPYDIALRTLEVDLLAVAEIIENWSEEAIVSSGERVPIRQGPGA